MIFISWKILSIFQIMITGKGKILLFFLFSVFQRVHFQLPLNALSCMIELIVKLRPVPSNI